MPTAAKPGNETRRLVTLRSYQILDTAAEPSFDRIVSLVQRLLGVPIALVSLIDDERQWFKACLGLGGVTEMSRDIAFCAHAILLDDVLEIPDARLDPRFATNPLVLGPPHVRAYLGAPLVAPNGDKMGTLCAIDVVTREFTPDQIASLVDLAALVVDEMELQRTARDRRLFERLTETSPNMMYLLEASGRRLLWSSPAGTDMLGYSASELRSEGLMPSIVHPDDVAAMMVHAQRRSSLADNEVIEQDVRVITRDGSVRWLLLRERAFVRTDTGGVKELVGFATDITALKLAEARVSELAVTDALTGLPNRRALDVRLDLLGAEGARGRRYGVVVADVDHFKKVNDLHGHVMGDRVLVEVGRVLRDSIRKGDLATRMGGEEFCVVYSDIDPAQLVILAERLRAAVAGIVAPVAVTASFGVCFSTSAAGPQAMLAAADAALYRAKAAGRNRIEVVEPTELAR